MNKLDRRGFLAGLFGTAAVVAAGVMPKAIEALSDRNFMVAIRAALPRADEIYSDGKTYGFATIKYINEPPYFIVTIPEGFKPMREESDRIAAQVFASFKGMS